MRSVSILTSRIAQKSTSINRTERYVRYNREKIVKNDKNVVMIYSLSHATSFFAEHKRRNLAACLNFSLHESGWGPVAVKVQKLQYKKNHKSN